MKIRNKENEFSLISLLFYLLVYKITIEVVYIYSISPIYSYMYLTTDLNINKLILSIVYLFTIIYFQPKNKSKPSTYLFLILEFFIIIPMFSYYWLNNMDSTYTFYLAISSLLITLILKTKLKPFIFKNRAAVLTLNIIFVLYVMTTIYLIVYRGGIDFRAFSFDSVYELRSEYNLSGVTSYLANWSTKVFCPFYLGYFYLKRNYKGIAFVSLLQLLMYLSFGNKAFLFSLGIILLNLLLVRRGKYVIEMSLAMSGINLLAWGFNKFNISDALQRAVPYRLIFIPSQIQYYYYDFFIGQPKLWFSETFIGKIFSVENNLGRNVSLIIGDLHYRAGAGVNANTGIFADAYANGGFYMMILISIFFALVLALVDASTTRIPIYLVVGALSYIMFVINDAPLLTTLITGGMLLMIFMLIILNSSIKAENGDVRLKN